MGYGRRRRAVRRMSEREEGIVEVEMEVVVEEEGEDEDDDDDDDEVGGLVL